MNIIGITFGSATAPESVLTTVIPGITVALVAGVVLFLLNWLRDVLMSHWKRKSEAGVLAFTLGSQLDEFISGCSDVVADGWTEDETGMPKSKVKTPSISFSSDIDWWVFSKELQHEIRSLPNKVDVADRALNNTWKYGDPWEVYHEREERYAGIGLEAVRINQKLSRKYRVPLLDRGSWNPEEIFRNCLDRYAEDRRKSESSSNTWDSLLGPSLDELKQRQAELATTLDAALAKRKERALKGAV